MLIIILLPYLKSYYGQLSFHMKPLFWLLVSLIIIKIVSNVRQFFKWRKAKKSVNFKGKVVFLTGASSGIGKELAI